VSDEIKEISVADARRLGKRAGCQGVIILSWDFERDRYLTTSWGLNRQLCDVFYDVGKQISAKIESGEIEPKV